MRTPLKINKRCTWFSRLSLMSLLLFVNLTSATNYYVSLTGSDLNPGTLEEPFRTIQRGADATQAGDSVLIMGGTYQENVVVTHSGSSYDQMITFLPYNSSEVIVDATVGLGIMVMEGVDFIKITGLTCINGHQGFYNGAGIRAMGNYGIYTYNTFHDNKHGIMVTGSWDDIPGGAIANNHDNEVANNVSYNNDVSGIWLKHADNVRVHHNVVYGNHYTSASTHGAITFYLGSGNQIYQNTVYNNDAYGIALFNGTDPGPTPNSQVYNNLVVVTTPFNLAFKVDEYPSQDPSNVYHHNLWYDVTTPPLFAWGYDEFFTSGQMLTFAQYQQTAAQVNPQNGVGDFVANPLLTDPVNHDYTLLWGSPAIDAGPTDVSTYDPDGTRADLGAFSFDQTGTGQIATTATLLNAPVIIPAGGGSFTYQVTLQNVSSSPQSFTAWVDVTQPVGGHYGPLITPRSLTLNPGQSIVRQLTQFVPGSAAAGEYTLNVYSGTYPTIAFYGSAHVTFQKSGVAGSSEDPYWIGKGDFDLPAPPFAELPAQAILKAPNPNPFNPSTVARFELRVTSQVSYRVYDTAGRLVVTLIDGWREAGDHQITFDGSSLPSGLYFANLTAGEFSQTQKLVLLK